MKIEPVKKRRGGWSAVALLSATVILTSACARTTITGTDVGCESYGEARRAMPDDVLPADVWGMWVADTDDRMTGACRD